LTIRNSSSSNAQFIACNSYQWTNGASYTNPGTYSYTTINAAGCDSIVTLQLSFNNGIYLSPKAILFGAYDSITGLMQDSLRAAVTLGAPGGVYPIPYLIPPHIPLFPTSFLPADNVSVSPEVLLVSGPNAIVDWIYIEIRDQVNNNTILARKHALIQRDGDVVSTDGISPLYFNTLCPGQYYVSIKHRNHLGVMTAESVYLSALTQTVDFTNNNVWIKPGITTPPRRIVQGIYTLWPGDASHNKNTKYNGSMNDKDAVLAAVLGSVPPLYPFPPAANTTFGYRNEDVNMDGKVRYLNTDNDRAFILASIIYASPNGSSNEIISQHTPN
jgi:hypothetical protein